jgi:transposase
LSGLLPKRRGPHAAHKLTDEVLAFVAQQLGEDPTLAWPALAQRITQNFGLTVHPRSIERALMRAKKKPE